MRLPFLQVSQEEMSRARTLAGYLGVPYAHAIGMTVALKAAALEAAPDGDVSGTIYDPNPAEWMAVQCGWPMDRAEALAVALVRCGFAMAGPSGCHAVAGMEPYARALDTSGKRSEAGRRGAEARKTKGGYGRAMAGPQPRHGHGMARDAKTQTQTQTHIEASASQAAGAAAGGQSDNSTHDELPTADPKDVLELEPTGTKPKRKDRKPPPAEVFVTWAQEARSQHLADKGLPAFPDSAYADPDGKPKFSRINKDFRWIRDAETGEAAVAAYNVFLDDEYQGQHPAKPWPFSAFLANLDRYRGIAAQGAAKGAAA